MQSPSKINPASINFGDGCVVDVRTGEEHQSARLTCAHHHVPLDQLDAAKFLQDHKIESGQPVYILCRSGKRAIPAAEAFSAAGHANVHVIEGGIIACETAGVAVTKQI